jgi:outer membrane protein TolC
MGRSRSPLYRTVVALTLLTPAPGLRALSPPDTLRLTDVLVLAEERNPGLAAFRHGADAAELREPAASTLPDPMLQLGFMNFGLPEFNTDMAMSMAPSVQLTQTLPWPGKLGRQEDVAVRDRDMARVRSDEASWRVRARTTAVFFEIWSLDRRLEVMRSTLELLDGFRDVALAMYGTGSGLQADVLRADVEIARTTGEIRRMEGGRAAAVAVLNGILDRPVDTTVGVLDPGGLPRDLPPREALEGWAIEDRPLLAEATLGVERASAVAARADREIWPDLRLGLAYGQRDRGFGTEHMGSAMVGLTLPIFAGSRQHALRDAALAEERFAQARRSEVVAEVGASLGRLVADLDATRVLVDLYRDEVVPQARLNVESAFSAYRVGDVEFLTLVDAQMTANRYEAELYALVAAYGATLAALESAVGRTIPRDGPVLQETR